MKKSARGGGSVLAFLLLHVFGLGAVIIMSLRHGAWDLAVVNGLVFLMLARLERMLCAKRYTEPMPVYSDGRVGAAGEPSVVELPSETDPATQEEKVLPEAIQDTVLVAA